MPDVSSSKHQLARGTWNVLTPVASPKRPCPNGQPATCPSRPLPWLVSVPDEDTSQISPLQRHRYSLRRMQRQVHWKTNVIPLLLPAAATMTIGNRRGPFLQGLDANNSKSRRPRTRDFPCTIKRSFWLWGRRSR